MRITFHLIYLFLKCLFVSRNFTESATTTLTSSPILKPDVPPPSPSPQSRDLCSANEKSPATETPPPIECDWSATSQPSPTAVLTPPSKQFVEACVQTLTETTPLSPPTNDMTPRSLECAVQTEMFLDEIDCLASKLDPERVSHYERVVRNNSSFSQPENFRRW